MDLARELGQARDIAGFLQWSHYVIDQVGFSTGNCLPVVAVCRDELMHPFSHAIARAWGDPFDAGALGGLAFLGRTGMGAALGHAPIGDGRQRFVVFAFTHIGVDADGTVGQVMRSGMSAPSSACGALAGFRDDWLAGRRKMAFDPDDPEQSMLRRRLAPLVHTQVAPSLATITELARQATITDLAVFLDLARGARPVDVLWFSGIVAHLADDTDRVIVRHAFAEVLGRTTEFVSRASLRPGRAPRAARAPERAWQHRGG